MTAEIALLNKEAVALAADSAVTISAGGGRNIRKIWTSANKIFALCDDEPIGVMVYGAAEFMSVPWETVIKLYRKRPLTIRGTVAEYAEDFRRFLATADNLWSRELEDEWLESLVLGYLVVLRSELSDLAKQHFAAGRRRLTRDDTRRLLEEMVKAHLDRWAAAPEADGLPAGIAVWLKPHIRTVLRRVRPMILERLPVSRKAAADLQVLSFYLVTRFLDGVSPTQRSGVVVAGFGSDQPFPAISAFEAEGTARGYLKYKVSGNEEVSNASIAIVAPFAQSEMVHAFMSGVTPDYTLIVESSIERVVKELPGVVLEEVPGLSPVEVGDIAARIASKAPAIVSEYLSKLAAYSKDNYIDPVVSAVASLPKDELAAMAESLVNLTSFKRRVSMAPETVGGPIDVAVISKGDGMVWIKRKHYFDPELNQAYLSRRFRRAT